MNEDNLNNYLFQLNNKNSSANYFVLYIVSGALFLAAICVFIFTNLNFLLVGTIVVAIIYFILFHLFKPSFVEMLVTENELTINYYSVATTLKTYQTISIDPSLLRGFEFKKRHKGLQQQLILTVDSKFGLADYPPISVSILSKKEQNQIAVVLSKIISHEI